MAKSPETNAALAQEVGSTRKKVNFSLVAALLSAGFAGGTFLTQQQALHTNKAIAADSQRATLFLQLQQQYNAIRAGFPEGYSKAGFKAAPGTSDYSKLDAYWVFCFSEWYATQRVNAGEFGDLWRDYYVSAISHGLRNPALRNVLENRILTSQPEGGDWVAFYRELARIARAYKEPLSPQAEARIAAGTV